MAGQKIENLLNLALDTTQEEREKSLELDVGYDPIEREWDVIVKYSGSLDNIRALASGVTELLNEYAIVTVKESRLADLAALTEVEYIEKPKRLFFQTADARRVSCIDPVQDTRLSLFGQGILVAVIDSGIDYMLPDFRDEEGRTRILSLWDQSAAPRQDLGEGPPPGYALGTEYAREQINEAIAAPGEEERRAIVPSMDTSGHGTSVAAIAAGNGGGESRYRGVAPRSSLLVVKLGVSREEGFPRTTELMAGIDYVVRRSLEYRMPLAVNVSFGNTYGAHDGTSLLERYIDDVANLGRTSICVGAGNEGNAAGHTAGRLESYETKEIELGVQSRQTAMNIQIWKTYADQVRISLITPSGVRSDPIQEVRGTQRMRIGSTEILVYYGEPSPHSLSQEIFIDLLPAETYIAPGVWTILLETGRVVDGRYQMWLPSEAALNPGTGFLLPSEEDTFTIPSTASRVITVGAYDALTFTYADFSGRGGQGEGYRIKPDLAAPGVGIMTRVPGGAVTAVTGTSFATPFVTGGAALLMEWGIIKQNDPYLYGEKIKAYLRKGARQLPGFDRYPNNQVGYGALCVEESIPY